MAQRSRPREPASRHHAPSQRHHPQRWWRHALGKRLFRIRETISFVPKVHRRQDSHLSLCS